MQTNDESFEAPDNFKPETLNFKPEQPGRRLTGKVAALPQTIRYLVNQLLDEGYTYKAIVQRLRELGFPGFFEQNIQRWKARGYDEWVRTQRELDFERARQESFAELYKNPREKANLTEASRYLAALQSYRALLEMQSQPSSEILGPRANTYFRLMRLVTRQGAEQTRRERLAWKKDTSEKSIIDQLLADPKKLNAVLSAVREKMAGQRTRENTSKLAYQH